MSCTLFTPNQPLLAWWPPQAQIWGPYSLECRLTCWLKGLSIATTIKGTKLLPMQQMICKWWKIGYQYVNGTDEKLNDQSSNLSQIAVYALVQIVWKRDWERTSIAANYILHSKILEKIEKLHLK